MAKNGVISDAIPTLRKKANLDDETAKKIRFFEVHTCKIYKELKDDYAVASINDYVSLYAERMPEEESEADPETDVAIYAFHFNKEPTKAHGVPFKFIVHAGEVFKDTKARLEKRTGIKGKNLEKVKFAVVPRTAYSRPIYLKDGKLPRPATRTLFIREVATNSSLPFQMTYFPI